MSALSLALYAPLVSLALGWFAFGSLFAVRVLRAFVLPRRGREDRSARWGMALQFLAYALVWSVLRPLSAPFAGVAWFAGWPLALLVTALMVLSVTLARSALARLGKQWALDARVLEDHALITDGPYRLVRHPIYTAMLSLFLASALTLSQPGALVLGLMLLTLGTRLRIRAEERLLRSRFGDTYAEYAARVPAVIPRSVRRLAQT